MIPDADHPQEASLAAAVAALRHGELATADAICRHLLRGAPTDPALHQLAAAIALQRGAAEDAARWARSSLAGRADHVPTLVIAGRAARACGNSVEALTFLRRAAVLAPSRADAHFLICATLLEQGDRDAQTMLRLLLDRFPDDPEGWRLLGDTLQSAGQAEAALVAFTRAARALPSAALHLRCGALLKTLGRAREAADACAQAVALDPADAAAWFALGVAQQDQREFAAAIAAYRKALELRPDLAEAAVNLGICHQERGDIAAAKDAYRRALRLRPESFGRIAQALATAPTGEVWLDLGALRCSLGG